MAPFWKALTQRSVLISYPRDMSHEAQIVAQVVADLNRRLPAGDRWAVFNWVDVDELEPGGIPIQQTVPRCDDPLLGVVVCLFGERVGAPLPADFPLPSDVALPDWVQHPWPEGGAPGKAPLTGTVFELLDAQSAFRRHQRPRIALYMKADSAKLLDPRLKPFARRYGFNQEYKRINKDDVPDPDALKAYFDQLGQLDAFVQGFIREGTSPFRTFGAQGDSQEALERAFRDQLLHDLPPLLGVSGGGERRELKGLEAFQPGDYDILFGRGGEITRILDRLYDAARNVPALMLVGRRGEGKSSLLRAGLVGGFRLKRHANYGEFAAVLLDGGELCTSDPMALLGDSIDDALGGRLWDGRISMAELAPAERRSKLIEEVARIQAADGRSTPARLFIGLDQAEELLVRAESDPNAAAAVRDVFDTILQLAERRLAWLVIAVPEDHRDRARRFLNERAPLEHFLSEPTENDLREIIDGSLAKAGVQQSREDVEDIVAQAKAWLSSQASPGPVLPLLSALLSELVRERRNTWKRTLGVDKTPQSERVTLAGVLDLLGERAWTEAGMPRDTSPDVTLGRLLRRLVVTGFGEGKDVKILQHCSVECDAAVSASALVEALKKQRLLYAPKPDSLRLVHVSILDHWKRAAYRCRRPARERGCRRADRAYAGVTDRELRCRQDAARPRRPHGRGQQKRRHRPAVGDSRSLAALG